MHAIYQPLMGTGWKFQNPKYIHVVQYVVRSNFWECLFVCLFVLFKKFSNSHNDRKNASNSIKINFGKYFCFNETNSVAKHTRNKIRKKAIQIHKYFRILFVWNFCGRILCRHSCDTGWIFNIFSMKSLHIVFWSRFHGILIPSVVVNGLD